MKNRDKAFSEAEAEIGTTRCEPRPVRPLDRPEETKPPRRHREAVLVACSTPWAKLPDPANSLRASLHEACPRDFAFFTFLVEDIAKRTIFVYQTVRRTMEITKMLENTSKLAK